MKARMAVVLLLLVSAAFFAVAQVPSTLSVAVPFSFHVGGKLLPAGSYMIKPNSAMLELAVSSESGKDSVIAALITRISASTEDKDSAVFDVVGNEHYLSEIYIQGEDGYKIQGAAGKHTHTRIQAKK